MGPTQDTLNPISSYLHRIPPNNTNNHNNSNNNIKVNLFTKFLVTDMASSSCHRQWRRGSTRSSRRRHALPRQLSRHMSARYRTRRCRPP